MFVGFAAMLCAHEWPKGVEYPATISYRPELWSQNISKLLELYEEYETRCFNDSTKQCFNYYSNFHLTGSALDSLVFENYKTPCTKYDYDLGISMNYRGTHEEWIHVQPSFIGFMQYLKEYGARYELRSEVFHEEVF